MKPLTRSFHPAPQLLRAGVALLPILLAGCASFPDDRGMDAVSAIAGPALRKEVIAIRSDADADAARAVVADLLRRPLTESAAVQIALLNNRELQATYNELGIAEAVRVRASIPANPRFSLSRVAGGGAVEIEAQIIANILALATLPARAEIAADRFRQAQLRAIEATFRTAFEARRAYVQAVAARQLAAFLVQAQSSAEAAVTLSRRLGESGAMNKLDQARNQVFYAETTARLGTARQRAASERERLVRALGLWGKDLAFQLPAILPALPARPWAASTIEVEAVRRRVDLQIARIDVEVLAKSYGLTRSTRFINLFEVSGVQKRVREPRGDSATERGIGVEFEVPLFDFGETRQREAEATYMQAVNRLTGRAVSVRSQAREAYHLYRSAYDIARHYQREVLPLRKVISEETLLRYNAMQIDVFSLLAESRERISSSIAAIEAQRDFWLADGTLLASTLGGGDMTPSNSSTASAAPEGAGHE